MLFELYKNHFPYSTMLQKEFIGMEKALRKAIQREKDTQHKLFLIEALALIKKAAEEPSKKEMKHEVWEFVKSFVFHVLGAEAAELFK